MAGARHVLTATVLAFVLERVLPLMPSVLVPVLSEIGGTIAFALSPRARAAVRANQLIVAPARRPRVRAAFVHQVRNYLETFRLLRLSPQRLERVVDVVGWDTAVAAMGNGTGAIFTSAHFGLVVLCGQILVARGYEVVLPVERKHGVFGKAVDRARSALGLRFVETDSAIGIHRVLRRGGILGLLADRAVTGVGERVQFFGREALLPSAHVALALRTGAPLIPGFAHRRGRRLVAHLEPPLHLERTGDHDSDVRRGVGAFVRIMERHIAQAPEEWTVFEPVWRE